MAEFIFKRSDYTHNDPDKDRRGVHKQTDFINYKPDGWSDHPNWAASSYPKDFIVIKVPGITFAEAQTSDHRKSWRDDFDYQIVATRPAQGEYDVRIFERNTGAISQNSIAGVKATKIRNYLAAWGCSAFSMTATDAGFTFSLWDAVRSANFWQVPVLQLAGMTFQLNSYSGATGIGNITVTVPEDTKPASVLAKIDQHGGTVTTIAHPSYTFDIERGSILSKFKEDVKRRMEQVYMRHQYAIDQASHDAVVADGGIITGTKDWFLSKLIDKMAG